MYIHIYIDIYMIRIARLAFSKKKKNWNATLPTKFKYKAVTFSGIVIQT